MTDPRLISAQRPRGLQPFGLQGIGREARAVTCRLLGGLARMRHAPADARRGGVALQRYVEVFGAFTQSRYALLAESKLGGDPEGGLWRRRC